MSYVLLSWLEIFSLVAVYDVTTIIFLFFLIGITGLCICKSMSFIKFGEFGAMISSNIFILFHSLTGTLAILVTGLWFVRKST
jgi:hypothetical protein